jgi:hypothetical protein
MKRQSVSVISREMQIKPTMRYYLLPVRRAVTKTVNKNVEKLQPMYAVGGRGSIVQHIWKTLWKFSKRLKTQ